MTIKKTGPGNYKHIQKIADSENAELTENQMIIHLEKNLGFNIYDMNVIDREKVRDIAEEIGWKIELHDNGQINFYKGYDTSADEREGV